MRLASLSLVVATLLAATPTSAGTITGSVVVVKDGKPVTRDDVYVYLEDTRRARRKGKLPGEGLRKEIRQKGTEFIPHVLVVPVGTEVAFPNYDSEEHNVFSPTDPPFDLGRYNTDKRGKTHRFEDTDEFDIFCDIHRQMWAKVKVVDSAYIVQVVNNRFTIENVPAGTYKVVAWTRNTAEVKSAKVSVTATGAIGLATALHLQVTARSGCHDRKDGTRYDKYAQCPRDR